MSKCSRCSKEHESHTRNCDECLEYYRNKRAKRRSKGLCVRCGVSETLSTYSNCETCKRNDILRLRAIMDGGKCRGCSVDLTDEPGNLKHCAICTARGGHRRTTSRVIRR